MYLDYIQLTILSIFLSIFYIISIVGAYEKGRNDEIEKRVDEVVNKHRS